MFPELAVRASGLRARLVSLGLLFGLLSAAPQSASGEQNPSVAASDDEVRACTRVILETSRTTWRLGEPVPLQVTIEYSCDKPRLEIFPGGWDEHFRVSLEALDDPSSVTAVGPEAAFRTNERLSGDPLSVNFWGSRNNSVYMPQGMDEEQVRRLLLEAASPVRVDEDGVTTTAMSPRSMLEGELWHSRFFSGRRTTLLDLAEHYQIGSPGRYRIHVLLHFRSRDSKNSDFFPVRSNPLPLQLTSP